MPVCAISLSLSLPLRACACVLCRLVPSPTCSSWAHLIVNHQMIISLRPKPCQHTATVWRGVFTVAEALTETFGTHGRALVGSGAGGDNGIAKMWNRREISVSSHYNQSHDLHPHPVVAALQVLVHAGRARAEPSHRAGRVPRAVRRAGGTTTGGGAGGRQRRRGR
eukprot:SAG25_NODE_571_length_6846_cov_4.575070_10_plen_166_part_00